MRVRWGRGGGEKGVRSGGVGSKDYLVVVDGVGGGSEGIGWGCGSEMLCAVGSLGRDGRAAVMAMSVGRPPTTVVVVRVGDGCRGGDRSCGVGGCGGAVCDVIEGVGDGVAEVGWLEGGVGGRVVDGFSVWAALGVGGGVDGSGCEDLGGGGGAVDGGERDRRGWVGEEGWGEAGCWSGWGGGGRVGAERGRGRGVVGGMRDSVVAGESGGGGALRGEGARGGGGVGGGARQGNGAVGGAFERGAESRSSCEGKGLETGEGEGGAGAGWGSNDVSDGPYSLTCGGGCPMTACHVAASDMSALQGPPPAGPIPQNPALDLRTMEELLQAPTEGVGDAILAPQEIPQGALLSNTAPNPREDVKGITIWSGITLAGPSVPPPPITSYKEVERDSKPTMDQVHISSSESTARVPSLMFKKFHFNISIAETLALMPKYAKTLNDLLSNKEKLLELANTPLNENVSAVLLKKLPKKLRELGKFLIPCDFSDLKKCMALADLGASINLMPLSVWKKLMLPELVPTRMTLEIANRLVSYPAGIAEDVFMQVGKFTFPADLVVVDYDFGPRVPLILGRPFLRTARALVDVHEEKLILRVDNETLTFNNNSGSTTSYFDPSLLEYESFYFDDDLKEFEDLLYYDPSINPPFIAERSDSHHKEFADELAHIISPPEFDHFYFDIEANPGELTRLSNENLSSKSVNLNKIMQDN
ncbi:reverse transcriptase domain-containing protein [Tanacetum coccineum]|uniref:Reverse transcriptase domain-containing protein n=1 Tax=Tanacetum coccineum TaxID=301880 RepID=A0ABQ4Z1B1_9ASTR